MADLDANLEPESLHGKLFTIGPCRPCLSDMHFAKNAGTRISTMQRLIIDDPLLRKDYGFLNFESVLGLMDEYNFHTSIAFIPHNWRRNASGITRMFRERPDRYSICFHGNDHTDCRVRHAKMQACSMPC